MRAGKRGPLAVLLLVLAVAAGAGYAWLQGRGSATPSPSTLLLAQQYPNAAGAPVNLAQYRGQTLVVNFWASWCAPCVEEMPELSALQTELHREMPDHPVQFLGLAVDNADNVKRFASGPGQVSYPLLVLDGAGIEMGRRFGNESGALPYTVVINNRGEVTTRTLGRVNIKQLRASIEQTIRAP